LDFEPVDWGAMVNLGGNPVPTPERKDTTVMWIHDQDAGEVASELEAGLERKNLPRYGFSLGYAFRELAKCVQVVEHSRAVDGEDPARLQGALELLINDQWAVTSFGLESVGHPIAYPANWADLMGTGGASVWHRTTIRVPETPGGARFGWDEALTWVREREGWKVVVEPESS
jgi:hypothetical protein